MRVTSLNRLRLNKWLIVALIGGMAVWPAAAQEPAIVDGTIRFSDEPQFGNDRCSIVNSLGEEFFIRQCDRRIVLARSFFSGNDLSIEENNRDALTDFVIDGKFLVTDTRNGARTGRILFATDANGLRTLFWVADDESFDPVDGKSVAGGVISYDRTTKAVTLVIANVLDEEGNIIRREPFFPSDLGANIQNPQLGNRQLFLPCGADRSIVDVDGRGEPILGCRALLEGAPTCGVLGNSLLLGMVFFAGLRFIRRAHTV